MSDEDEKENTELNLLDEESPLYVAGGRTWAIVNAVPTNNSAEIYERPIELFDIWVNILQDEEGVTIGHQEFRCVYVGEDTSSEKWDLICNGIPFNY